MKKQNIINLIRYHVEKNDEAFATETAEIAREFSRMGDVELADHLMELVSNVNYYVPQSSYKNLKYLEKANYSNTPLYLPNIIEEDVIGITKAISNRTGLSKFLFYGAPGTGKTESVYQIARILNRDLLVVDVESLIDSRLGETAKNITKLFDEINHLAFGKVIVFIDEIDSLILDRVNHNDHREMGRVTSTFIKKMDMLNENVVLIATTNLFQKFDKAIIRRFDAVVSFDRYSKDDLISVADLLLSSSLKNNSNTRQDMRLFNKIMNNLEKVPYPGDLKQIIKTAVAFSDETNKYDYLRKLYLVLNDNKEIDIQELSKLGYTTREIEILTRIPKSSVSRKLKED